MSNNKITDHPLFQEPLVEQVFSEFHLLRYPELQKSMEEHQYCRGCGTVNVFTGFFVHHGLAWVEAQTCTHCELPGISFGTPISKEANSIWMNAVLGFMQPKPKKAKKPRKLKLVKPKKE